MTTDIQALATCPEELKEVLAAELRALGATALVPGYRAVRFSATPAVFYRAHLELRTASRLLRVVGAAPARSREGLVAAVRALPWPQHVRPEHGFIVEGIVGGDDARRVGPADLARTVGRAIRDRFEADLGRAPRIELEEPRAVVVAFVRDGECLLSFDTTGRALHKRGYRGPGHPAPLKETLAAALLLLAGYDGEEPLVDPMCGSGTLAVEGAMLAYRKAPQIHRKKGQFLLEWQLDFDRALWREVQEAARRDRRLEGGPLIVASDLEPRYVSLAREHALRARVERHIHFEASPFAALEPPAPAGLLVCNLPYGERLRGEAVEGQDFFAEVGATLKRRWSGWRAALLTAEAAPYAAIGLRPSRRIPLMNGNIPCRLLLFELYAGSRRAPRTGVDAAPAADAPAGESPSPAPSTGGGAP